MPSLPLEQVLPLSVGALLIVVNAINRMRMVEGAFWFLGFGAAIFLASALIVGEAL